MHVALLVPAPFDLVSGGYAYDRRIVAELHATGVTVDVFELPGDFPVADSRARQAADAVWAGLPADATPVIDGLALVAFDGLAAALRQRGAVGLIHHPVSLETGLREPDRATLDAAERRLFPSLARLIVTSATTAATLSGAFGIPVDRISVIVPGTDDAPRRAGSSGATSNILSIGTLIPRKGHDVLLDALATLRDLDWRLSIVGSPERDVDCARALLARATALGLAPRVRFAGELVGDALARAWHDADIFALTTRYEGYGMVIAEALKRGLPVVVTDGGAAGALVEPGAGFVCPVDDRAAVARSLRTLLTDVGLHRAMAERAWQVGQTLPSWRAQAARFATALR